MSSAAIAPECEHAWPGDNAHIESFIHSLKAELVRSVHFVTDDVLRNQLQQCVRYCNHTRLHSALGYRSQVAFEQLIS